MGKPSSTHGVGTVIQDPNTLNTLAINADGSINTNGGGGGGGGSNNSVSTTGTTAPAYGTEVAFINGAGNLTGVSPTNPLPTINSGPALYAGQAKITTTGTAVQLPANTLTNAVTILANGGYTYNGSPVTANSGPIFVGTSSVNTTGGGTGAGFPLLPGAAVTIPVSAESVVWIDGAANDWVSFLGV